ncbi:MAG TPA: molybdopterin molybdotransferase MoeA [Pseudonocardiaceae bacterium]|nr:molybdopterin molybdotransferase MoeA [Pseudonocardiaceae bacterium]
MIGERMSWARARAIAAEVAKPLDRVVLDLGDALGTVLAAPLAARLPQPCVAVSAMDGYAVAGTPPWRIIGPRLFAGDRPWDQRLLPGQAAEIATGAPVPAGADAVLPVEHAHREGNLLGGMLGTKPHIRQTGEDFAAGDLLVPESAIVTPAVLGLAAALGCDTLDVHRRARVRVALTGDELLRSGLPEPGRVRDAIGPMLPGLIERFGGELLGASYLPDRIDALGRLFADGDEDVLVVCGSTSVGAADHLHTRLAAARAQLFVDGVACRPGHPQVLAGLPDGRFVLGLPGNPAAALAAALTLLGPLLGALGGRRPARLGTAILRDPPGPHPRDTLLKGVVVDGDEVVMVGGDRPGNLVAPARADALAVIPPDWAGPRAELLPLR